MRETRVPIARYSDIVEARFAVKSIATQAGFAGSALTVIATAVAEIARNILAFAGDGDIHAQCVHAGERSGIMIVARDNGPGIADIELAMQDGYSTANRLGFGLAGTRRLMDEFEIVSGADSGTTVTMTKWVRELQPRRSLTS